MLGIHPVLIPVGKERVFGTYHLPFEGAPVVLFLHGYHSSKNDRFRFTYELAEELSTQGIASLRIDFRGCGDSDGGLTIESQIEDAITALKWLSKQHKQIGIMGRSLGGAIALKAATYFPVETLVLVSPVFDGLQWGVELSVEDEINTLSDLQIIQFHAEADEVLNRNHFLNYQRLASPKHCVKSIQGADHTFSCEKMRKNLGLETREWFIKAFHGNQNEKRSSHSSTKREASLET